MNKQTGAHTRSKYQVFVEEPGSNSPLDNVKSHLKRKISQPKYIPSKESIIELRQKNILNEETQIKPQKTQSFVIDPESTFTIMWKALNCIVIAFYLFQIPFVLSFDLSIEKEEAMRVITRFSICLFGLDIIMNFNCAFYEEGKLNLDRWKIAWHYLTTNIILDSVPIIALVMQLQNTTISILMYTQILFVLKIYQIYQSKSKFQDYLQLQKKPLAIYRLFEVLMLIIWLCHVFGCLFHAVGVNYLKKCTGPCNSWLNQSDVYNDIDYEHADIPRRYVFSFYWAVSTMITVGYGDITPKNFDEVKVTVLTMFVSCMTFTYSINAIWQVIRELNENKEKYQYYLQLYRKYVTAINYFMKDHAIDRKLQSRIQAYFKHLWETEKSRDYDLERTMIHKLAPSLQQELYYATYGKIFDNFMKKIFSTDLLKALSQHVQEINFCHGEVIFTPESQDQSLYYIAQGSVELYHPGSDGKLINLHEIKNEVFGQVSFITGQQRTAFARCNNYTRLFKLSREALLLTLNQFQSDKEAYHQLRDQIQFNGNYSNLFMNCWICDQQSHISLHCPKVHLIVDTRELIRIRNSDKNTRNPLFQRKQLRTNRRIIINDSFIDLQRTSNSKPPCMIVNLSNSSDNSSQLTEPINQNIIMDTMHNFTHFYENSNPDQVIQRYHYQQLYLDQILKQYK